MPNLKIFIASPGDVAEERDIVSKVVVPEVRRIFEENPFGRNQTINIEAIRWETHVLPDVGDDAQDVVNKEISEFDILVGIMWKRFGSQTKRAASGTGEEFDRAYNLYREFKRPKIMFYFRTSPFFPENLKDVSQIRQVLLFREKIRKLGVFYFEYDSPLEFERKVREHLVKRITRMAQAGRAEGAGMELEYPTGATRVAESTSSNILESNRNILARTHKETKRPNLFFSYVKEDLDRVRKIYTIMISAGFEPWLDVENLVPGQSREREINEAIKAADYILVFLSKMSVAKKGLPAKEIKMAMEAMSQLSPSKPLVIPVRLEQTAVPEILQSLQPVDIFNHGGMDLLIKSIEVSWQGGFA